MESLVRKSLAETVAEELRNRMKQGGVDGRFPGVRPLARLLGVSVPTLCQALHALKNEGLLEGGGSRRRWKVVNPSAREDAAENGRLPARDAGKSRSRRLLFLASQPLSGERHSGVEVFAELLDLLGVKGWEVMHRVEHFASVRKPRKSWDELVGMTRPDVIVALGGTEVLGKWARETGIPTLFVGGDSGDSGVPMIAVRVSTMLSHVLGQLLKSGHRNILLPLCARSPDSVVNCRTIAAEILMANGLGKECITIADTAYSKPEVMVNLLRKQWKNRAPDALVLLDWREFVAASGYFKEAGIVIPRDLSVVVLSHNTSMDWHLPKIAHFAHPVKLIARSVSKWVTQGQRWHASEAVMEVRARWVDGQSVLARK